MIVDIEFENKGTRCSDRGILSLKIKERETTQKNASHEHDHLHNKAKPSAATAASTVGLYRILRYCDSNNETPKQRNT
jgi:hypothetical protein